MLNGSKSFALWDIMREAVVKCQGCLVVVWGLMVSILDRFDVTILYINIGLNESV